MKIIELIEIMFKEIYKIIEEILNMNAIVIIILIIPVIIWNFMMKNLRGKIDD